MDGNENDADFMQAALGDLNEELLEAAELALARWEKGDLAEAMRDLARITKEIRILEAEATGA